MGKALFGVIALFATVMLVDSLTCKQCSFGLSSFCFFSSSSQTCSATNTSVCGTTKITFGSVPSFGGFVILGCLDNNSTCGNTTTTNLVANYNYSTAVTCCSTDNCNTVSAAPSAKTTLGAVVSVAALASLLGRML